MLTDDFQTISFNLPKKEVRKIQFFLGQNPGQVIINRIKLKTLFRDYHWQGLLIKKLFDFSYNINKTVVIGDKFFIEPGIRAPSLKMVPVFSVVINKISRKKTFYYFLALILSLIFFYFIHYLNLRGLKLFFNRKILLNMVLIFFIIN